LRYHQLQNYLLEVRPVILGVAVGDANSLHIAVGGIVATECKARGVEMIAAQINVFLGTDCKGEFLIQQVATIGVGLIEDAAQLKLGCSPASP
jgi:hypothetical protein